MNRQTKLHIFDWFKEHLVVIFLALLSVVGLPIIDHVFTHDQLETFLSSQNYWYLYYGMPLSVFFIELYKAVWETTSFKNQHAVKTYQTDIEIIFRGSYFASIISMRYAMDLVTMLAFFLGLFMIGHSTHQYEIAHFFETFYAVAIVPFIASINFMVKKKLL
ncbi:MAG: hypothetical protein QW177_05820 [Candidatus Nitrosotenuis sp.]